jgi:hypothetical protein
MMKISISGRRRNSRNNQLDGVVGDFWSDFAASGFLWAMWLRLRKVRETSTGFPVCAEMIARTRITQSNAIVLSTM